MIEYLKFNRDTIREYNGDRLAYVPKDIDIIERLL
jgi:hypothetical protein